MLLVLTIYEVAIGPSQHIVYQHRIAWLHLRTLPYNNFLHSDTICCFEKLWEVVICSIQQYNSSFVARIAGVTNCCHSKEVLLQVVYRAVPALWQRC